MKNASCKKSIVMLLTIAFLIAAFLPYAVSATGMPPSVAGSVEDYMDARRVLLSTGDASALEEIAVPAIVTDEFAHRQYLIENEITLPDVQYLIDSVNTWDNYILIEMRELADIMYIGIPPYEVAHTILIMLDANNNPVVVSDNYKDELSGFESCSYVPCYNEPDVEVNAYYNRTNCFLYIANREVGYQEGPNKETKYGTWAGSPGAKWCASFVTWCADQARVNIPRSAYVPTVAAFFKNLGRYHKSASQGGSYTPQPGDVFFITANDHTGIVYSVSSSYMTVIDGNWGGKVAKRNISLTDSSIIGYGTPGYISTEHIWDNSSTIQHCTVCGAPRPQILG